MLQFMRDYARSWLIKIILWTVVASFISTIFLVWGVGREISAGAVAMVDGKKITLEEYQELYNRIYDFYKKQGGDIKDETLAPIIKKGTLDSLIIRRLQLSIAKQEGLIVTDEELVDEIQGRDMFKRDGRFDRDIYMRLLRGNRINPSQYEDGVREELLIKKAENLIKDGVKVSKKDVRDAYIRLNEKIDLDYFILAPSHFINSVAVNQEKLEGFYNNNKPLFQREEEINVEYIAADLKDFEKDIQIEDTRINDYYNNSKDQFKVEKRVKARHILITFPPDADEQAEADVKEKALSILKEIKGGGDFADLAKKYSQDPSSAVNGGDLGYFSRGQMVKPFEDAAFALKEGELSEPIKTQFGYHIIKVEKIEDERTRPLSEVREDIIKSLKTTEAREKARAELEMIKKGSDLKSADLNQVTKGHSSIIVSTGSFKKDDKGYPVLGKTAFALKQVKGEVSDIVEDGGKIYILRYKEKKDAFIPTFEEIRGEVERSYRDEEAKKMVDLEAGKILEELKKGKEFNKTLEEFKAEKKGTGFVTRNSLISHLGRDSIQQVEDAVELIHTVFNTKKGDYNKIKSGDRYYIIYVKGLSGIDEEKFKKEETEFTNRLLSQKRGHIYQLWIENIKRQAEEKGRIKITKGFV